MLQGHPTLSPLIFARSDYWRRSTKHFQSVAGFKEWSHFCAVSEGLGLIVNFSVMEQPISAESETRDIPRVLLLVRQSDGTWDGEIAQFFDESVEIGERLTDLSVGPNRLRFAEGAYLVDAEFKHRALKANLRFNPLSRPAIASSVRLSGPERMRWLVVPRLTVEGEVCTRGKSFVLRQAPAYHDRNWGHFRWSGDYSWEWATILPEDLSVPWTLVYMRISDGTRNRTYSKGLMVWYHDHSKRVFHGNAVQVHRSGVLTQKRTLRVPQVANLMATGASSSVPQDMKLECHAWSDHICVDLVLDDFAQIAVPNDTPTGLTLLSEASGRAEVSGKIRGIAFRFEARVMGEFNSAGA
jgi:hypothetical protein